MSIALVVVLVKSCRHALFMKIIKIKLEHLKPLCETDFSEGEHPEQVQRVVLSTLSDFCLANARW